MCVCCARVPCFQKSHTDIEIRWHTCKTNMDQGRTDSTIPCLDWVEKPSQNHKNREISPVCGLLWRGSHYPSWFWDATVLKFFYSMRKGNFLFFCGAGKICTPTASLPECVSLWKSIKHKWKRNVPQKGDAGTMSDVSPEVSIKV